MKRGPRTVTLLDKQKRRETGVTTKSAPGYVYCDLTPHRSRRHRLLTPRDIVKHSSVKHRHHKERLWCITPAQLRDVPLPVQGPWSASPVFHLLLAAKRRVATKKGMTERKGNVQSMQHECQDVNISSNTRNAPPRIATCTYCGRWYFHAFVENQNGVSLRACNV